MCDFNRTDHILTTQAAHTGNTPFPGTGATGYTLAVGRSQVKLELRAIPEFNHNLLS
jgi:hypothetical protein